jgi:hypothetical protein
MVTVVVNDGIKELLPSPRNHEEHPFKIMTLLNNVCNYEEKVNG